MLLFAALTLILTGVTVWGGRVWLRNSETLVFAVGDANGAEARFAAKLATVLKNNSSRLRLKIVANADNAKALAQFDRRQADLAVLRTDAKVPPRARALAMLEHDVLLLISPGGKKIKSLAELKKKKIAVSATATTARLRPQHPRNLRSSEAASRVQTAPPNSTLDKLLAPGGYGAVIAIAHALEDREGQELRAICQARRLHPERDRRIEGAGAAKSPAYRRKRWRPACCPSSPAIPDDDLDTIGLQWLLVAQSRMPSGKAGDLARIDL